MKKILVLAVVGILALTGCDATAMDTMSCTYQTSANNLTTNMKYDIDYQGNEVKKVRITYDYMQTTNDNYNNGTNGNNRMNDTNDMNGTNNNVRNGRTTNGTNATTNNNNDDDDNQMDGVGTGTDGTTNDTQMDEDGIVDGIVGSAIDSIVGGVTSTILDVAGLRDRHATVQNTYNNVTGFSVQNTVDTDSNYKVTYVIDYDSISDNDLNNLNLSRDVDTLRSTYTSQGFTCK